MAPATIALLAAIVVAGCAFAGFTYDGSDLDVLFGLAAFVFGYGVLLGTVRRGSRIGRSLRVAGMFLVMSLLATLASAVIGKGHLPYLDDALEMIDRTAFLGYDWPATALALTLHPAILWGLRYAYVSLNWQPLALFVTMAFERSRTDPTRFIAAWSLGVLACILPFRWLPARGAYVHFGIPFSAMHGMVLHLPWEYPVALEGVRRGSIHVLGAHSLVGLVTVPSFHACAATLLAWGFRRVPFVGWPFVALNLAMFVSAVPIGGHYVTDIAAGFVVAAGSIAAANRLARIGMATARPPVPEVVPGLAAA